MKFYEKRAYFFGLQIFSIIDVRINECELYINKKYAVKISAQ